MKGGHRLDAKQKSWRPLFKKNEREWKGGPRGPHCKYNLFSNI